MEDKTLTLGSLFDGSGGFPLGGLLSGIKPVWASEIAPFPIRVTTKRLPWMKHLGDVKKMSGREVTPVDIITCGSPCQDMSIAGKREGLEGSRSSLFYESIRIVREMREVTQNQYPRFFVWENVPGALSSNNRADFQAVLEEIINVKYSNVSVPKPEKWNSSGLIVEDDFSLAWRVLSAEYWGVPQRRKRIYLVADFRGPCAGKILFESEGLSGYSPPGCNEGQTAARDSTQGAADAGCILALENYPTDSRIKVSPTNTVQTLTSRMGTGGGNVPMLLKIRGGKPGGGKGPLIQKNQSATLSCNNDQTLFEPIAFSDKAATLSAGDGPKGPSSQQLGNPEENFVATPAVLHTVYTTSKNHYHVKATENVASSLVATDYKDPPTVLEEPYYIVRRLTPSECASLQGFPKTWCSDLGTENPTEEEMAFWTDVFNTQAAALGTKPRSEKQIRKWLKDPHTDSAEYEMWGNGVALPCVVFVLSGIAYFAKQNIGDTDVRKSFTKSC